MKGNLKMKRLNNKGFTLIELLAVIVILAIVVAITIPSVLSSINGAKTKAYKTSLNTIADWLEREFQMVQAGDTSIAPVDSNFSSYCTSTPTSTGTVTCTYNAGLIKAAGGKASNYSFDSSSDKIYIDASNGRACVKLTASTGGDYGSQAVLKSDGCKDSD